MEGGESLEADFRILDTDSPVFLGLVTKQARGWEASHETGTVKVPGGALLPLKVMRPYIPAVGTT